MNFIYQITIEDLGKKELELYSKVISIQGSMDEMDQIIKEKGIYEEYKKIHQEYARLHKKDLEAIKRGLFLSWYSMAEPSCFTGVRELDHESEKKIIHTLNRRLARDIVDYELSWMLSYYSGWELFFERFKQYPAFYAILSKPKIDLPDSINNNKMASRGQMGIYWNSIF